jgi:hypothetical protein
LDRLGAIGEWLLITVGDGAQAQETSARVARQLGAVVTTPNRLGGSIWQAGRAPAVDEKGNIYVVTGNGDYDGVANFSESFQNSPERRPS